MLFIALVIYRQAGPACAEVESGILGLALAGENTLFVAVGTHNALGGLEVGKVPHQFALHKVVTVKHIVVHIQVLVLVLLAPHHAGQFVLAGHGVGAVLGKDHRAAVQNLCPAVHLFAERRLGVHNAHAAHHIPAVIAVQADEIRKLLALAVVGQAHHHDGIGAGAFLGVKLVGQVKQRLKVCFGTLAGALGFV